MMRRIFTISTALPLIFFISACFSPEGNNRTEAPGEDQPAFPNKPCFSGIYPHLAMWNNEDECGTGALAVWNNKLWAITYGPHCDKYSSDKLYEIDENLNAVIRKESVGGTHANRLIHPESEQLFIGCYAVDKSGNVRVISREDMHGRLTGTARSPWDAKNKVFFATMEEGLYEVDVNNLAVKTLIRDGNLAPLPEKLGPDGKPLKLPKVSKLHGYHGKGFNSDSEKLYYSNNGIRGKKALKDPTIKSGALAEYKLGDEDWSQIRAMQFTDIATRDGIYGNLNPDSNPIWALGFDAKSVVLMSKQNGKWSTFRLPKASHSYDGAHGWNTEWPRIRDIGEEKLLMTMHGAFWEIPRNFGISNASGIRMLSNYLKVVGDFCEWRGKLVLGCDDSAKNEFLNKRDLKSKNGAAGQSNSNLVFMDKGDIHKLGPKLGRGNLFLREDAKAGQQSDPMLIGGFSKKIMAVNSDDSAVRLQLDFFDRKLDKSLFRTTLTFNKNSEGKNFANLDNLTFGQQFEWVRVTPLSDAKNLTVHFELSDGDIRPKAPSKIFNGIAQMSDRPADGAKKVPSCVALMLSLGGNKRIVGMSAKNLNEDGNVEDIGNYSLNWKAELKKANLSNDDAKLIKDTSFQPKSISFERDSVLIIENGKRFRLPINGNMETFKIASPFGFPRTAREVVTERDIFNCGGIFYELPAMNAFGFSRIRPISSHNFDIFDYCSYRGLLLISGIKTDEGSAEHPENPHIVTSEDKKFSIWAGSVDDLWKLGKCVGRGSVWFEEEVADGQYSDPMLICGFDKKTLLLSSKSKVSVTMELDIDGTGLWLKYKTFDIQPGKPMTVKLDQTCSAYWARFKLSGYSENMTATLIFD